MTALDRVAVEEGLFLRELEFPDIETMARFAGNGDENLSEIELRYPVSLLVRGNRVAVRGPDRDAVDLAFGLLEQLYKIALKGHSLLLADVRYAMDMIAEKGAVDLAPLFSEVICTTARGKPIRAKTEGQRAYLEAVRRNHILFAVGPAGTGTVCQEARSAASTLTVPLSVVISSGMVVSCFVPRFRRASSIVSPRSIGSS